MNPDELYQSIILDHSKNPRNEGEISPCEHSAEGYNPLCGDRVCIFVGGEGRIQFTASGCAISKASASILTELASKLERVNLEKTAENVLQFLESDIDIPSELKNAELFEAIAGVKKFPARVKCAALPWNTLLAALRK